MSSIREVLALESRCLHASFGLIAFTERYPLTAAEKQTSIICWQPGTASDKSADGGLI
jgi:hypothetical protein